MVKRKDCQGIPRKSCHVAFLRHSDADQRAAFAMQRPIHCIAKEFMEQELSVRSVGGDLPVLAGLFRIFNEQTGLAILTDGKKRSAVAGHTQDALVGGKFNLALMHETIEKIR